MSELEDLIASAIDVGVVAASSNKRERDEDGLEEQANKRSMTKPEISTGNEEAGDDDEGDDASSVEAGEAALPGDGGAEMSKEEKKRRKEEKRERKRQEKAQRKLEKKLRKKEEEKKNHKKSKEVREPAEDQKPVDEVQPDPASVEELVEEAVAVGVPEQMAVDEKPNAVPSRLKRGKEPSKAPAFDNTPSALLRSVPTPESTPRKTDTSTAATRSLIALAELVEIKDEIVSLRANEKWDEIKVLLKRLVNVEPRMQDLGVTRLAILIGELRKVPVLEVYADVLLRMWKGLAAQCGIRPRNITPLRPLAPPSIGGGFASPTLAASPVSAPVSSSPLTSQLLGSPVPELLASLPLSLNSTSSSSSASAFASPTSMVVVDATTQIIPIGVQSTPTSGAASLASPTELALWGSYTDADFDIHELKPRNTVIQRLYQALLLPDEEGVQEHSKPRSQNPLEVAKLIEEQLHRVYAGGDLQRTNEKYRQKFTQLHSNMANPANSALRHNLVVGEITPSRLVAMRAEELGPDSMRKAREASKEYAKLAALHEFGEKKVTDTFKCGKCGERKTTYFQMQTRSADEPMTTFVTCVNCGHAWKF